MSAVRVALRPEVPATSEFSPRCSLFARALQFLAGLPAELHRELATWGGPR